MIVIYTDGSCLTNPGNGGWAAIISDEKEIRKISGSEKNTTNNRMELLAPINALKEVNPDIEIKIYTDSQYVKNGITEWINTWLANNWKTSKKEDKFNVEMHSLMEPVHTVSDKDSVSDILDQFVKRRQQIFIVSDEFGTTNGLITLEDVIETLLGVEIVDEHDSVVDMRKLATAKLKKRQQKERVSGRV